MSIWFKPIWKSLNNDFPNFDLSYVFGSQSPRIDPRVLEPRFSDPHDLIELQQSKNRCLTLKI